MYLIEVKSCNISYADANDAIEQLDFTEDWIKKHKIDGLPAGNPEIVKVFLHDKKDGRCGMYASTLIKSKKILRPNVNDPQWKQVLNFAKKSFYK